MGDIADSDFLRILRDTSSVPEDQIRSAQERQRDELVREGSCRSLFAILCEKGLIDERVARTIQSHERRRMPGEVTPHTPTVVLPPPDETPRPEKKPSSSTISRVRSARPLPADVEKAAQEERNLLGPFILIREVGKGGMGRVYRAWEQNVGRVVALKVIDTEDASDRERFVREAQIAGRLHHPSIATVFQAGEAGTRGYIAMQFIEGGPIDGQRLPLLTALALIRDAARALSYAHEQGVVHRDVKPGNLMVDGKGHVFLTDFGLAKEIVGNPGAQLSITGTTFGTPQFMSPEQARGEHKKIDARSDVYSLGATLYAILARRPPFASPNIASLLLEVLDKKPPPVSKFNPEISPELEMIVERAMAKEPSRRFSTMAAFADALDRLIREGRYQGKYGLAKALFRRWAPRAAVAVVLGIGLRFALPRLLLPPPAASAGPAEDPSDLYGSAADSLGTLEGQGNLDPDERGRRIDKEVLRRLDTVLGREPGHLRAAALRVRALYVKGDRAAAQKELSELGRRKEGDYRLPLVSALIGLEDAVAVPCPLPLLESPRPGWEEPPAELPAALQAEVKALLAVKIEAAPRKEWERDAALLKALRTLVEGGWAKAADDLQEARTQAELPVIQAAWCRAAYLAGNFRKVKDHPASQGRRERLGAGLALATASANPSAELRALLLDAGTDAPAVHAALARLDGEPEVEAHVAEGMKGAAPELQAALWAARLRARALCGTDEEPAYREALGLAGKKPATWQGRLALIELQLGLGSRLQRSRKDGRPWFDEAARVADGLTREERSWAAPRLLAAAAKLKAGRLEDARADLNELPAGARKSLLAASLELAGAERSRKAGSSYAEGATRALDAALAALATSPDLVEGRVLSGSALLLLAQHAAEAGADEGEPVRRAEETLRKALERLPGCVEARFHHARAMFLLGEIARRGGKDGKAEDEAARADAEAALAASAEFLAARHLRGIVNFSLGNYREAVADWRLLVEADASWNTADLRSWIELAEARLKR